MRSVEVHEYGTARDVLIFNQDAPLPEPAADEIRIRIHASSVNNIDCAIRGGYGRNIFKARGLFELPLIMGRDVSGVVEKVGEDVTTFAIGDEVYAAPNNRGCADYVTVKADFVAFKPKNITHLEAACFPYVTLTAWAALVEHAGLTAADTAGQKVFLPRGSGGVGVLAIQWMKAWGAHVATTCSTANLELVRALGADEVLDYTQEDFDGKLTDYDVALDMLGHDMEPAVLASLKENGSARYVSIVSPLMLLTDEHGYDEGCRIYEEQLAARKAEQAKLGREFAWSFMHPSAEALATIAGLIEQGKIKPVVDRVYPLDQLVEAHEYVESKRARGKVVIDIFQAT
ncbi:MAG: zinc-binding dehydrogenase [Rhodospirillaceae bacterium]|jgi:reticulon-4-interacting protein 1, mitochondrial|nr:zinc-binding dehydrogenase [Rhodospirillaceae bacterium]MBT5938609.1 zinc-binding dehydrogenase [Rhodospirillaceae bacterium]